MSKKNLLFSLIITITCLLLTISSIQAMSIQGTPITETRITLTQQTKQILQAPLVNKSQIKKGLSSYSSLSPIPTIFPPSTVLWGTAFGNGNDLNAYTFAKTNNGGYLIGGYDNNSIHLIKIDINGGTEWSQIYSAPPSTCYKVTGVQQTFDNGYIVTGYVVAGGTAFLLKLDSLGNQVWMQTYTWTGGTYFESYDVKQYSDGGYIVVGAVSLSSVYNVALFRTNSIGNVSWAISFRNSTNPNGEFGQKVLIENVTGNIVTFGTGFNHSTGVITNNFYKYNSGGTRLSNTYYSASSTASNPGGFIQTQDNGFALVGSKITYPSGSAQYNYTLVKLSNTFGLTWVKNYQAVGAEYTSGTDVKEIPGDGFILTGCYGYYTGTTTLYSISLVKVNSLGTLDWIQNDWAFSNYDVPWYVDYANPGFVIGGNTNWDQGANSQIFIVKVQ